MQFQTVKITHVKLLAHKLSVDENSLYLDENQYWLNNKYSRLIDVFEKVEHKIVTFSQMTSLQVVNWQSAIDILIATVKAQKQNLPWA